MDYIHRTGVIKWRDPNQFDDRAFTNKDAPFQTVERARKRGRQHKKGQNRTKTILRNVQQIKCPSFPTRSFLQGKKSHPLSARATEGRGADPGGVNSYPILQKKTGLDR